LTEWDPLQGENNHLGCATAVYRSDRKKEVHIFNQAHRIIACHSSSPTQHYCFFDFLFFFKKNKTKQLFTNMLAVLLFRSATLSPKRKRRINARHAQRKKKEEKRKKKKKKKKKKRKKRKKKKKKRKKKTKKKKHQRTIPSPYKTLFISTYARGPT
jgi:hypothetical protein